MTTLITIYQVKDEHTRLHGFMGLEQLRRLAESPTQGKVINMRHYGVVFNERDIEGAVLFGFPKAGKEIELLDTLFRLGNDCNETFRSHFGFTGRSMSVSDIVRIRRPHERFDAFYYCDSYGWTKIDVKEVPNWIKVGMHASGSYATDVYPFEVIKVPTSGKVITIRGMDYENAEGYDYYSNQVHTFTPNPDASTHTVRQHKDGFWRTPDGMTVYFGSARKYADPHF